MPDIAFVMAPRQNSFFVEIVDAIRDELRAAGHESSVHHGAFPPLRDDLVYVLVPPHEWFALAGRRFPPSAAQLRRTVGICAEQPGTSFFSDDLDIGKQLGAMLDVNAAAIRVFRSGGLSARHFPLGWTPSWSFEDLSGEQRADHEAVRGIDVLHLGIFSERRAQVLAANASLLSRWRCRLSLSDDHGPNFQTKANYALGDAKWQLLRNARVLLNVHVADRPYFEWQRVVQAVCNGALVVSEHSTDHAPMEINTHFLSGGTDALGLLMQEPLEDEDRRREMARAAWLLLKEQQPFSASVRTLIEEIDALAAKPVVSASAELPPGTLPIRQPPDDAGEDVADFEGPLRFPSPTDDRQVGTIRAALKDLRMEMLNLRRQLTRFQREALAGEPIPVVELDTDSNAWRSARPRVSVLTALYNYERHIEAALDSCARSDFHDLELVVVDDGSRDASAQVVRDWIGRHQDVPVRLLRHPVNRGLGPARNTALSFARGEFALTLDADNCLMRAGLGRLVHALDADPGQAFAYGLLQMFSGAQAMGLRSYFPWTPARLRTGNYIDAMALWRLAELRALGGYSTDDRLYGWEDYELWCNAAENDRSGVLVSEFIARYRVTRHSMLSITNISATTAVSVLVERYPRLMADVEPPL